MIPLPHSTPQAGDLTRGGDLDLLFTITNAETLRYIWHCSKFKTRAPGCFFHEFISIKSYQTFGNSIHLPGVKVLKPEHPATKMCTLNFEHCLDTPCLLDCSYKLHIARIIT